jgi:hypothetical protein
MNLELNIDACEHTRLLRHTVKHVAVAHSEIELVTPHKSRSKSKKQASGNLQVIINLITVRLLGRKSCATVLRRLGRSTADPLPLQTLLLSQKERGSAH